MSIEQIAFQDYLLSCDICGQDCDEEFESFHDAVYFKKDKEKGWISRKIKDDWHDICPVCAKKHYQAWEQYKALVGRTNPIRRKKRGG